MSKKYNIDELFRKGAQRHTFRPGEADWQSVARHLDASKGRSGRRWLILLAALILAGSSYLLYANLATGPVPAAQPASQSFESWNSQPVSAMTAPEPSAIALAHRANVNSEHGTPQAIAENTNAPNNATSTKAPVANKENNNKPGNSANPAGISSGTQSRPAKSGETPGNQLKENDDPGLIPNANRLSGQAEKTEQGHTPTNYAGNFDYLERQRIALNAQFDEPVLPADTVQPQTPALNKQPAIGLSVMGGIRHSAEFFSQTSGIGLQIPLKPNLRLASGVGYWWRTISDLHYTTSGDKYGFGRDSVSIKLEPQQAHYITIPIRLSWQLSARHQLTGGIEGNILAATYSKITKTTQPGHSESIENTRTAWGYDSGFRKLHMNLLLGYNFQLNAFWSLGADVRFGHSPALKKGTFNKDLLNNNNVSVYIQYQIW